MDYLIRYTEEIVVRNILLHIYLIFVNSFFTKQ